MATYRITYTITTETKAPRRGERERQRQSVLHSLVRGFREQGSLVTRGEPLRSLRSVKVVRVK